MKELTEKQLKTIRETGINVVEGIVYDIQTYLKENDITLTKENIRFYLDDIIEYASSLAGEMSSLTVHIFWLMYEF